MCCVLAELDYSEGKGDILRMAEEPIANTLTYGQQQWPREAILPEKPHWAP